MPCFSSVTRYRSSVSILGCLALALATARAQVSVWTYHDDNSRDGQNTNEIILNLRNVNSATFGKLFSYAVDGCVYAQPLYVPDLNIQGQTHNVLFIETENDTVYAFDANSAGANGGLLWKVNLGPAAVTTMPGVYTNRTFGTRYNGDAYTDIMPQVGITGTPVIDTNSDTLYVDAFTGVVGGGMTNYTHTLHALSITNGQERPFSPVTVKASVSGTGVDSSGGKVTFNARQQNQRPALTLAGGIVYVCFAGYADTDPYHGWIIGFNETNLLELTNYVFNTTPNATTSAFGANAGEGGIWMGGDGLGVDANTNLYVEVANGSFSATNNSAGIDYGDSFIKFSTGNGLAVSDYFTPWEQATWQANDTDLGSAGVMLLPDQPGTFPHELAGSGKAGEIFVVNRDQFTARNDHFDSTNVYDFVVQTNISKINGAFDTPAYFNGRIYYAGSGDHLKSFAVTNGALAGNTIVTDSSRSFYFPGATPSISANGTNDGIVWALQMPSALGNRGTLVAANATNVATELYTSAQVASRDQLGVGIKFAVPTVADGEVFAGSSNSVSVFGLLAGTYSFSSGAYSVQANGTNATITVNRLGGTNGAAQVSYATVSGGTASSGVDYSTVSGVLNWTNGESDAKTFTIPIFTNMVVESNVTVDLALSNPTNGASALGVQATAALTIIEPPIDAWKINYFGANANNAAIAGDSADPENDDIPNLLAYAYAFDPLVINANPFAGKISGNQFQLEFPRDTSASDLTYVVQSSWNLTTWSNQMTFTASSGWVAEFPGATAFESATNGTPPNQFVNVTITISTNVPADSPERFLRLEVHR
ncbi:MAG TPA: Calx-beta domain-containing protein [Verrucomicrobiae bacterium]|nr:Calx-beta domain-containing protein [Verrucomicrobiae bacterium]